jgi:predicted NUDIX family NTP pyrophosphohydrolase
MPLAASLLGLEGSAGARSSRARFRLRGRVREQRPGPEARAAGFSPGLYPASPASMSERQSAGLLLHRLHDGQREVLLVHPGGPFWAKKDEGAWSIPKGEFEAGEDPLAAAKRELEEETGILARGPCLPLGTVRQRNGKLVHAWALEQDADAATIRSNTFTLEWPPRSGQRREFPEVDRAEWFDLPAAARKVNPAQRELLERLAALVR